MCADFNAFAQFALGFTARWFRGMRRYLWTLRIAIVNIEIHRCKSSNNWYSQNVSTQWKSSTTTFPQYSRTFTRYVYVDFATRYIHVLRHMRHLRTIIKFPLISLKFANDAKIPRGFQFVSTMDTNVLRCYSSVETIVEQKWTANKYARVK